MHTHRTGLDAQLKWAHDMIRRDLAQLQQLAGEVRDGLPADAVQKRALRFNCLRYCDIVHLHHGLESAEMFPRLLKSNPALAPVIDKLEADHVHVADLLDEIEAAARELASADTAQTRQRIVGALHTLATDLLAHLAYEEEQVSPTLRTWSDWP